MKCGRFCSEHFLFITVFLFRTECNRKDLWYRIHRRLHNIYAIQFFTFLLIRYNIFNFCEFLLGINLTFSEFIITRSFWFIILIFERDFLTIQPYNISWFYSCKNITERFQTYLAWLNKENPVKVLNHKTIFVLE